MKRKRTPTLKSFFQVKKKKLNETKSLSSSSTPITRSKKKKPAKICPLFLNGALPAERFKKKPPKPKCGQAARFELKVDETNPNDFLKWKIIYEECDVDAEFGAHFHEVMNLREPNVLRTQLHIICNHPWEEFNFKDPKHSFNKHKLKFRDPSPSQIKSILQKNVRRGRYPSVTRIGMYMTKRDFQDLIRRIGVIVLEDAVLHPLYSIIMWLTTAVSKGLTISESHVNVVLTILKDVGKVSKKDYLIDESSLNLTLYSNFSAIHCKESETLIRCILIRGALGGMKGDVKFIRQFAAIWFKRFSTNINLPSGEENWLLFLKNSLYSFSIPINCKKKIIQIQPMDMIGNGIDFHCSNMTEDIMPRITFNLRRWLKDRNLDCPLEKAVNSSIWHFNSKNTTKVPLLADEVGNTGGEDNIPPFALCWNDVVKKEVINFQKRFLKGRLQIDKPLILD